MAITFPFPTSDVTGATIRYNGSWSWFNVGGHNAALLGGDCSQLDTKLTLASSVNTVTITIFSNTGTQPLDIYLNGTLQTRPTLSSSGAWIIATILTNVTAGSYNITLKGVGGQSFYLDTDYGYTVVDSSPSIAVPDNFGPIYSVQGAPLTTNSRLEGGFVPFNGLGYNMTDGPNIDMSARFMTDQAQLRGWVYCTGSTYVVYQDGVQIVAPTVLPTLPPNMQLVTFASGLSGTHEYEVHITNAVSAGGHVLTLYTLMLAGSGSGLITHSYAARDQYLFIGDSQTQADIQTGDSRIGYVYKFGVQESVGVINGGHNSLTSGNVLFELVSNGLYVNYGATYLKKWCVLIGQNDAATAVSTATYQSNVTGIINALQSAYPTIPGNIIKILPSATSIAAYNAVLPAAIAASTTGGVGISLIDISTGPGGTYVTPGDTDGDGIHPSAAGYDKLVANLEAILISAPATSYTQSLSASSGFTGNAVTITYTPNGTTTATLTPAVSGVSGVFSPTSISLNGTTPVTVTFTPSTAGTASLSSTVSGLTSPAPNTYTVTLASVSSTLNAVKWNLVGVGTLWTGTPFTLVSGGGSITQQTVTDNTHATITITGGTSPWVISDGSRQFTLRATTGAGGSGLGQTFVITGVLNI